jgi:choline dehydrogenase
MGGLVRSAPDRPRPDIQLYFNPVSYTVETRGARRLLKPDPHPGFIIGFNACRPTSEGRIEIASPDPTAPPRITPNYLSTNHDVAEAVAGARLVGRLEGTRALRRLIDGAPAFDLSAASDAEIIADFRARAGTVFHPCATCRMAPEADGGVVDPRLRVRGVERLRIADASIFPDITSANTNAPAIMVGRRAAEIIREDAP